MSDVQVTTIATRPISNRRIVARALGGILRPYDADGVEPRLVADFANNFYFANNYQVPLSTAFTHARSSSATMVDSTGTLITVGSDVPRIGHHVYNGSAWVNEGYLHESESRTNEITYSEDFTDAYWSKSATLGTLAVDAVGPDGETSAVTLVDSGAGGTGAINVNRTVNVATSTAYTFSIFAKADQLSWVALRCGFFTSVSGYVYFNLAAGSVGTEDTGLTGSIESVGSGWYRCSVTFTSDVSDTAGIIYAYASDGDGSITVDLDGTSSILIYGAQFEEGSTPSSYIPTSGSTVTRSADTMTASNLPWPTPNFIGPELVTNGTFDTDSDWIEGGSWEISGGSANKPSTGTAVIYQQNVLTVGKVYQITFDLTKTSGTGVDIRPTYNSSTGAIRVTSEGTNKVTFVSGDGYISFASVSDFIGSIDNISVREIDPLAVSIKMDGRMTGDTYTLIRWHEDANNYIVQEAGASDFDFEQSSVAVVDTVTGGSFTSGILVPYTIASRHGSTFINGAVDGTALTANTTPTSLPDLSASDLSLGYDYMGTIKEFAVWNVDITDAGIEEASS